MGELNHDIADGVWRDGRGGLCRKAIAELAQRGQHLAESGAPFISGELPGFASRIAPSKFGDLILIGEQLGNGAAQLVELVPHFARDELGCILRLGRYDLLVLLNLIVTTA